jgi:hypothetical protein
MATLHHNIDSATTIELLAPGDNQNVSKISICNNSESYVVSVDLYIRKKGVGKFNLLHAFAIPQCVTYVYDGVGFNNRADEFGLYIQCAQSSGTPDVDIVIA